MTKLQKRPPPAYPGLSTNTVSLEGGIRYESLSQDTRPPIPLMAGDDQAALSGGLGSNNPYNTAQYQQRPTFQIFSPVSPMDAPAEPRAELPATYMHAPEPHRHSMNARKSVELRRLNGTPYNPDQSKKVKVAQDMHEGALPPAYKRTPSDPVDPTAVAQALTPQDASIPHDCNKCGKRRQTVNAQDHTCTKCNKSRSNNGTPSQSRAGSTPHSRVASQEMPSVPRAAVAAAPTSPTIAGPSAMPGPRRCCNKCGKMKKPATAPLQQQQFGGGPSPPHSAPLPGVHLSRPLRPGISIEQAPRIRGVNPQIDVIPPSASTYRGTSSPFSQYGDETPLVAKAKQQEYSLFRNSSLVRSLSRRLSGRDHRVSSDGPLPSQQLRASQANPAQGTGTLINMISKAINESGDKNDSEYARLNVQEQPSRPSSPFSFMETPNETEGYEMKEMRDGKEKGMSPISPQSEPSIYSPIIIEETLDVDVDRRSRQLEAQRSVSGSGGLGVPGAQQDGSRPPITRFKSLRQGVNRATSVTRATSLRRLGSLKTVHTAWYRDDMAIEGHNGESLPVF